MEKYYKKINKEEKLTQKISLENKYGLIQLQYLKKGLEIKLKNNIDNYKKELEKLFKISETKKYQSEIDDLKSKLEKLQNYIKIQKNKNTKKLEEENNKKKSEYELIIKSKKESLKNKLALLEEENNKKILLSKNEFDKEYKEYINKIKNENNIFRINYIESKLKLLKQENKIILEEYKLEMKEKYEARKNEIKKEFDKNHEKEIDNYKENIIHQNKEEIKAINNNIINIEQNYINELSLIKEKNIKNENNSKNEKDKIYNNIKLIYYEKILEEMNKEENKIINNLKNHNNNKINLEEYITQKKIAYNLKLNKLRTLYKLSQKEFTMKMLNTEFYNDFVYLIIKLFLEYKPNDIIINKNFNFKNNLIDTKIINKLLSDIKELITKYSNINKNKDNKDCYFFLEEELNKFKEEQRKKINECYENYFRKNINIFQNLNINYIIQNLNRFSKNCNSIIINNDAKNGSKNEKKIININKINQYRLDYLPKLNEDIKNQLSFENLYLYNKLINLLYQEYKSLDIKINILNSKNILNNRMNSRNDNKSEKNINNKSLMIEKDIINVKMKLDKIKNDCNILFNDIFFGVYNSRNINDKFRLLIENIEENIKNKDTFNNQKNDIKNNSKKSLSVDIIKKIKKLI